MTMLTMYEKLMSLPIFKGVGPDQVSQFLEKTDLNFQTCLAGDTVIERADVCDAVTCVLTGDVEVSYNIGTSGVTLKAYYGMGKMIGLDRLYGLDTYYPYEVIARQGCGTMSFSKNKLLSLVKNNEICLINLLNILSLRSQISIHAAECVSDKDPLSRIAAILLLLTDRDCLKIRISNVTSLVDLNEIAARIEAMSAGTAAFDGDNLIINSRNNFLDFIQND